MMNDVVMNDGVMKEEEWGGEAWRMSLRRVREQGRCSEG